MAESLDLLHDCLKELETVRREADDATRRHGVLADYLDRGHPTGDEYLRAHGERSAADAAARDAVTRLKALIADLAVRVPGSVAFWAERHIAVCRLFRDGHPGPCSDLSVLRHVAQQTCDEWARVAKGEPLFVAIHEGYLRGYEAIFDLLDR